MYREQILTHILKHVCGWSEEAAGINRRKIKGRRHAGESTESQNTDSLSENRNKYNTLPFRLISMWCSFFRNLKT